MEVNIDLLQETKIGQSLKYLKDYLEVYGKEMQETKAMSKKVNHILVKWKNYANNQLFDDNVNH